MRLVAHSDGATTAKVEVSAPSWRRPSYPWCLADERAQRAGLGRKTRLATPYPRVPWPLPLLIVSDIESKSPPAYLALASSPWQLLGRREHEHNSKGVLRGMHGTCRACHHAGITLKVRKEYELPSHGHCYLAEFYFQPMRHC